MGEALLKVEAVATVDPTLTMTQIAILQWIAYGKDNIEIALLMNIERPIIIQRHVQKIMELTNTASRSAAVAWALRRSLIK